MSYTNKTQPTKIAPEAFLKQQTKGNEQRYKDAASLIALYTKVTRSPCVMWNKIFGFGSYDYLDSKGGSHTFLATGFALSSTGFTLYSMVGWATYAAELKRLGKCKLSGTSCLAIKRVEDIDMKLLSSLIQRSFADLRERYSVKK